MKLPSYDWASLEVVALQVIEACQAELPEPVRAEACKLACIYRRYHPNAPHIDPEAMYMLGEYFAHGEGAPNLGEGGVVALYLGAIAWYCEDEGLEFEEEVRKTYLHELGHHLGWDEDEVAARGLA